MILNNFEKFLWVICTNSYMTNGGVTLISGETFTQSHTPLISGWTISNYEGGNACTFNSGTATANYTFNYISLTFGNGTTEPTADNYQMESPYDTTNHFSWANQVQSSVADNLTKVITASITNISEEDLTVSEIGVVMFATALYNHILIARSLITPVTIAPNETKTFQYTLDLSGITG